MSVKTIRIFISSPGDVADERDRARGVIQQLRRTFAGRLELEALLWEQLPLSADASFQDGIDLVLSSQGIDIAVFILWSRLGSPTGPLRLAPDGRQYRSGTEREWELMWQAREQTRSRGLPLQPEILVYTRDDDDSFHQRQRNHSDELRQQELLQKLQVGQFIREEFQDVETGKNLRAYHSFDKPVTFAQNFRAHLTKLLESLTGQATDQPVWDIAEQGPPFRGLQAFEYEHAGIFFGREDEIVAIRSQFREQACRNCAFLLISGGSGSGKSSLARAGVMPDICQHELDGTVHSWVRLAVRPGDLGDRPLLALLQLLQSPAVLPALATWAADLRLPPALGSEQPSDAWLAGLQLRVRDALGAIPGTTGPQRLLLLVDQLEELFTSTTVSAAACSEFFAALETLARSGVVWVLATVRSDFYHECQKYPALVRMKSQLGHFDLIPPASDGLLRVITGPALLAGLQFELEQVAGTATASTRTLADVILREAADQAELLPLLEHLLLDLYEHRRDGLWLTFDRYRELGGLQGALRLHCERVFQELPPATQAAFPAVLSRLLSLSGDNLDAAVRRAVRLDSLPLGTAERSLTDALVKGRILAAANDTQGHSVVSVAHEAVLRTWPRVLAWTADNREHLRLRGRVELAEQRWRETQSDDSLLLNEGVPLREGRRLLQEAPHLLSPETAEYITLSLQTQMTRLVQQKRRRTLSVAALTLLLIAGFFGWIQLRRQADDRQATALASGIATTTTGELSAALTRLQELRQYALPKLQLLYRQPETARHLHLAIARLQLGDTDADLLPAARDRALECRPEQLLPLTKLLQPWAATLQPELRQITQDQQQPATARLHAACLLAAWEPVDGAETAWSQPATAEFVAAQLAAQNPVFVGAYQEVLRPQAGRLTAPLATLFANPAQTEVARTIATGLIADYAKDNVPALAQVLLTADPAADKLLFPLLESDRPRAITEFQAVLQQQLTTDWADPPLNPAWSVPAESLQTQMTAAHGMIAERFAFCMDMPLPELLDVVAALKPAGYRPTRLRPVVGNSDEAPRMSAVWVRDGGQFAVHSSVQQEELPKPDEIAIRDGLLLADLAFVPGSGPQSGWLTLWSEPGVQGEERRCLAGVDETRLQSGILKGGSSESEKLFQLTLNVHNDADGNRLYSAVYSTAGTMSEALPSWPGHDRLDLVQRDVAAAKVSGGSFLSSLLGAGSASPLAGLWAADVGLESELLIGATPAEIVEQARSKAAAAWRPAAVAMLLPEGKQSAVLLLQRPLIADALKEALAIRQGAAAVALLRLGAAATVWPLLESHPDPRLRSEILHRLSLYGVDGRAIMTQLTAESGSAEPAVVSRRRSLIQGLGELAAAKLLPPPLVAEATSDLLLRFAQDPDSGVHGMCEWTLRQLGAAEQMLQAEQQFQRGDAVDGRRWYLTKTGGNDPADRGLSFAIIDATEPFVMGSPLSEPERFEGPAGKTERRHRRQIGRVVAIGMHEVTVSQFLKFRRQHDFTRSISPTADSPMNTVTWYDAAAFCNWLSEQEGLDASEWCYEPGEQDYAEGMRIKPNFAELQGYRLPTEAEWERVCRADTVTSRYFGETDRLLGTYAWYTKNSGDKSMQPVSTLRPNGAGAFGLYGNAVEWCMDVPQLYSSEVSVSPDLGQGGQVSEDSSRGLRGGSFFSYATLMRSAFRNNDRPGYRNGNNGFRVSRTYNLRP